MKISFLFLVYDRIYNEQIWKENFFDLLDESDYSIHIHHKPGQNRLGDYFRSHSIPNCIKTKWADISLVIAQTLLLKQALKDKDNHRFVFLSQSCIPVKNPKEVVDKLRKEERSIFNERPLEYIPRYENISRILSSCEIKKASQWCILNRKHAEIICNQFHKESWYGIFSNVFASDEIMYFTILNSMLNLHREILTTNDLAYATTFTNWGPIPQGPGTTGYVGPKYKYEKPKLNRVKEYSLISEKELIDIIKSDSLFARKFNIGCRVLGKKENLKDFIKKHLTSADNHL